MNLDLKELSKQLGKQLAKKTATKVMAWIASGLAAAAPYILIGAGIIIVIFLFLAPIIDVLNNWNEKKDDVVEFYEKYMNLFHFRGWRTNEEHFAKKLEISYQKYLEAGNICIDVPLALATYYYPFDTAYDEDVYNFDLEELEESGVLSFIWNEIKDLFMKTVESQAESIMLKRKEKKVLNLLENMVSINEITYDCKYNEDTKEYEIDFTEEIVIEEYTPSFLNSSFPTSDERCIDKKFKIYDYYLDFEKYDNYLRDVYINKSNGFESDSLSEKEKNHIIDDIHIRAELYNYIIEDDDRFNCGENADLSANSPYGVAPCGTYLGKKLSDYGVLPYFTSPVNVPFSVTSCIGMRPPIKLDNGEIHPSGFHCAFDLVAADDKSIYAAATGTILFSGRDNSGSHTVQIEHVFNDQKFYTIYMHMQAGSLKKRTGDSVIKGEKIGIQGATGKAKGAHLHFVIAKDSLKGEIINPGELFLEGATTDPRCRQQIGK